MRDRLDSLTQSLYDRELKNRRHENSSSRPKDEEEPYAWISQTAPASPIKARSRAASIFEEFDQDDKSQMGSMAPAISVERLGEKVRKKIKSALNKMEQPNALPPVHRARETTDGDDKPSGRFASKLRLMSRSQEGSSRKSSQNSLAASIELPIFGDFDDPDMDLALDDEKYDNSSSPEQDTVLPRMDSNRPHIQSLFLDQAKPE